MRNFKKVKERFINKILSWHKEAESNLRTIYIGTLRITIWSMQSMPEK